MSHSFLLYWIEFYVLSLLMTTLTFYSQVVFNIQYLLLLHVHVAKFNDTVLSALDLQFRPVIEFKVPEK